MCSYIDIALSGKMHFAIACLGQCVPTVCISYNGKFEGLYMHFGLKELIIEPSLLSDYKRVTELFNSAFICREDLRKQIASRISAVRKLSYVNFANI